MPHLIIPARYIDQDTYRPRGMAGVIETAEDASYGAAWPESLPIYPRREWAERKREQLENLGTLRPGRLYLDAWNDQTPESSCVYNATESAWRYLWARSLGHPFLMKCSPMAGYINQTTRRHSGSTMWGAMEWATTVGLLPERSSAKSHAAGLTLCHDRAKALCKHTWHQNTPFTQRSQLPDGWRTTAKHFRVLEWVRLDHAEHFASALLHRLPIVYGRQGHSICACDLVQDTRGRWLAEYIDSYDTDRGDNGRLYDSERNWNTGGAWAAMSVTLPANPLAPCGNDGQRVDRQTLRRLYPAVTDQLFTQLVRTLPAAA